MDKDNNFVVMGEGEAEITVRVSLTDLFNLIDKSFETFRFVVDKDGLILKTFNNQHEGFKHDEKMEDEKKNKKT